jgi:hypothetical protein
MKINRKITKSIWQLMKQTGKGFIKDKVPKIILYFGAEFTKFYALKFGAEIRPDDHAMIVETVQVESKKKSISSDHKH